MRTVLTVCVLSAIVAQGSSQVTYNAKLVPDTTVVAGEPNRILVLPALCTRDGSVLVRVFDQPTSPLIKIAPDGKKTHRLTLQEAAAELRKASDSAFTVTRSGEIILLATNKDKRYLVKFDGDGKYKSHVQLESNLWIEHLAVFGDGESFLVSGFEVPEGEKPPTQPLTAILDQNGRLMRKLELTGDDASLTSKSSAQRKQIAANVLAVDRDEKLAREKAELEQIGFVTLGTARGGPDGKVYLLRNAAAALIHVLQANGDVERTLRVSPPEPGMRVTEMQVAEGRVALTFNEVGKENGKTAVVLVDAITNERISTYLVDTKLGGALACYQGGSKFGFLGSSNDRLAIHWSKAE